MAEKAKKASLYDTPRNESSEPAPKKTSEKAEHPKSHEEKGKDGPDRPKVAKEADKGENKSDIEKTGDTEKDAGGGMGARHAKEREEQHHAHESQRRDLHGQHRAEHRQMHERHQKDHEKAAEGDHDGKMRLHRRHEKERHELHHRHHREMGETHMRNHGERVALHEKHEAEMAGGMGGGGMGEEAGEATSSMEA